MTEHTTRFKAAQHLARIRPDTVTRREVACGRCAWRIFGKEGKTTTFKPDQGFGGQVVCADLKSHTGKWQMQPRCTTCFAHSEVCRPVPDEFSDIVKELVAANDAVFNQTPDLATAETRMKAAIAAARDPNESRGRHIHPGIHVTRADRKAAKNGAAAPAAGQPVLPAGPSIPARFSIVPARFFLPASQFFLPNGLPALPQAGQPVLPAISDENANNDNNKTNTEQLMSFDFETGSGSEGEQYGPSEDAMSEPEVTESGNKAVVTNEAKAELPDEMTHEVTEEVTDKVTDEVTHEAPDDDMKGPSQATETQNHQIDSAQDNDSDSDMQDQRRAQQHWAEELSQNKMRRRAQQATAFQSGGTTYIDHIDHEQFQYFPEGQAAISRVFDWMSGRSRAKRGLGDLLGEYHKPIFPSGKYRNN